MKKEMPFCKGVVMSAIELKKGGILYLELLLSNSSCQQWCGDLWQC